MRAKFLLSFALLCANAMPAFVNAQSSANAQPSANAQSPAKPSLSPGAQPVLKNPALVWEDLPYLRPGVQVLSHTSKNPFNRTVQDFLNYTTRDGQDYEMAHFRGRSGMLVQVWFGLLDKKDQGIMKLCYGSVPVSTPVPAAKPLSPGASSDSLSFVDYFNTSRYPHLLWEAKDNIWWGFPCQPFKEVFKAGLNIPPNWYQFTLHCYREDRFSEKLTKTEIETIGRKIKQAPGIFPGSVPGNRRDTGLLHIGNGTGLKKILTLTKPGVIRQLRLEIPALKDSISVDSLFIRITTDGKTTAWLPIPFFFGGYTGTNLKNAKGLPAGFDGKSFYNFFPMPFWKTMTVELENRSPRPLEVRWQIDRSDTNPYRPERTGLFTVQYNPPTPVAAGQNDFVNLAVHGSGVMVGAVSKLTGAIEANFSTFVDGSHTPAIETTGGEDYFNHSYGIHPGFTRPFSGGLAEDIGYRFHIIDYIPFSNGLLFTQDHAIYQEHDRDGVFNSAIYYYLNADQQLVMTDSMDIGDETAEQKHAYKIKGSATRLKRETASYEGYYSEPFTDDGRWTNGQSRFTVSVDPANDGVRIRKRIDQTAYHQYLKVYVDGQLAGEWFEQGANYYLNRQLYYNDSLPNWEKADINNRFRDTEFEIPARLTHGKSRLSIRLETIGSLAVDPRDAGLTNEYYYWIYSYRNNPKKYL